MRTPVAVLTGVDPDAMAQVMVGLAFDLPHAVAVRHRIDVEAQVLERVVSDVSGIVEHEEIALDHACVACALREDVVPTLERLARDGRWGSIVAHLPVGASAAQLCTVLAHDERLSRHLRVSSVVTALTGSTLVADLLGDALLRERERHSAHDDARGVGEVACAMVEHADVVAITDGADQEAVGLARTLARPGTPVVEGTAHLAGAVVVGDRHDHRRVEAFTDTVRTAAAADPAPGAWSLELSSDRAFHPARLLAHLDRLGGGRWRSRGCFWLPTRPDQVLAWDGAGGQLGVGGGGTWGRRTPRTRLLLTGVGSVPTHLGPSFELLLTGPGEVVAASAGGDGFEPWLGPIRDVA